MDKHQEPFGQDLKQGEVDVPKFASPIVITIHIQRHGFAFGVKSNFYNCSAKCLTLAYDV